ncbi:virginiamycin B lyase family protein [Paracraurococcus lichenis]|uniref:Carboxypeptidase regulatory-like domain-containing protein n=1 Tax=Paracraurococcus lichenis TaxID=3064888 RepID=A0ABT9E193_9PROT|nr:carboxypeptidase regulatory-like domain-containing protein [Paracraurococcus sp. LOR1-02]MDO9709919.1 carboxypeptidase regulatory-like domain-containing protein [Paracraurococcus sp. LOR1-02]
MPLVPARSGLLALGLLAWAGIAQAEALSGTVRSAEEGPMAGVLVSAQREGTNVTVTVVTDAEGRFAFPEGRLAAGPTRLSIRAAGWDLAGPEAVTLTAAPASAALVLRPARDLPMQLTNAEWIESLPGGDADKHFLQNCTNCHRLVQPLLSDHDEAEFVDVQRRMAGYAQASSLLRPQVLVADRVANQSAAAQAARLKVFERQAAYLARVNLRQKESFDFALKTFPRPAGRAARVIVTEYDLPEPTRQPHDVIVTPDGMVWYNSFTEQVLGRLDPRTGEIREWEVPTLRPDAPKGSLALRADRDGHLWLGLSYQGGVARFDPRTEQFRIYPLPAHLNRDSTQTTEVEPRHLHVDGKLWIEDSGTYSIYRMDVATGAIEVFQPFPIPSPNIYDLSTDAENNVFFTVFGRGDVGRVDAKTGQIRTWPTPTPDSSPRRGMLDRDGRFWFGEWKAGNIGMFDPRTESFREWRPPTPWFFPYDVAPDRNGEAWTGSMLTDKVARLNPKTGEFVEYLLPRPTNIRRVFVTETERVQFWAGSNHGASILRLEPLD